jgi:hypothetical protein
MGLMNYGCPIRIGNPNIFWLVVGIPTPLKNKGQVVNGDAMTFPINMESH